MDPCTFTACCEEGNTGTGTGTNTNSSSPLLGEIRADIEVSDGRAVDQALYNKIVISDHDAVWEDMSFDPIPDTYFVDNTGKVYLVSDGTSLTIARRDAEKALSTAYQASNDINSVWGKLEWTSNALSNIIDDDYWKNSIDQSYTYTERNVVIKSKTQDKGYLGIGTDIPQTHLEVIGNARVLGVGAGSNFQAFIGLGNYEMNTYDPDKLLPRAGLAYNNGKVSLSAYTGFEFYCYDVTKPAMVLSFSGTVGIKTGFAPKESCSLHVNHDNAFTSGILVTNTGNQDMSSPFYQQGMLKFEAAPNTIYNAVSVVNNTATTTTQNAYVRTDGRAYFSQSLLIGGQGENQSGTLNSFQLKLTSDSAVKPSSAQWTVSSDERLKEDIELADIDLCLDNVRSIPLKYYKWRDDVYTDKEVRDRHKLGWIAQDVKSVFPKAVTETDMCGYADCMTLNTDQIYASMYGAIQKLATITDDQSKIITDLLKRVSALESGPRGMKKMTR